MNRLTTETEFFIEKKGANFNWLAWQDQSFIMKMREAKWRVDSVVMMELNREEQTLYEELVVAVRCSR